MAFQSIFDFDHYPTPKSVIEMMLQGVVVSGKIVLEPSAGAGNIVDYVKGIGASQVIACELNNDLRRIVSQKCEVVASDFLSVTSDMVSHVDLIVMNPPFSKEEDHILHAYKVAPGGCEIVSLCNDSMLDRTGYEKRKQISELIELYGYSDNLGECFSTAERPTQVSVGLIRIFKPKTGDQEFDGFLSMEEDNEDRETEGVMGYNYLRDLVNRYIEAVRQFDNVMEVSDRINSLSSPIGGCSIKFGAYTTDDRSRLVTNVSREQYRKTLQKESWKHIFRHLEMDKYVTTKVKEQINRMVEKQVNIPFTLKNIYLMVDAIYQTHETRMKQTLVEAFEKICSFSDENSTAGEKWKTNSDYKINKKFIIPWIVNTCRIMKYETVHIDYRSGEEVMDIVKALCFLSGSKYENVTHLDTFCNRMKMEYGKYYEWGFFRIKGFKKGTMHFEFTDESLLDRFNYEVAKAKGWQLPKQRKQPTSKQEKKELTLFK